LYGVPPKREEWEEVLKKNRALYDNWRNELILDPQKLSQESEKQDHVRGVRKFILQKLIVASAVELGGQ